MKKFTALWKTLIFGTFLVFFLFTSLRFLFSEKQYLINFFEDDAYYYFEIAKNFVQTGKLTFDGITLTNGFHPLWLLLLLPFYGVIKDPILVLRAIGVFSVFLTGVASYLGLRYLKRFSLLPFSLGSFILFWNITFFGFNGMETPPLLLLLSVSMLLLEKLAPWKSSPPPKSVVYGLSVSLSLLLLARLDTIWLVGVIFVSLFLFYRKSNIKSFLIIAAGPTLTLLLFFAINYFYFGNLMPVSGAVKSLSRNFFNFNSLFLNQLTFRAPSYFNVWPLYFATILFSIIFVTFIGVAWIKQKSINYVEDFFVPTCLSVSFIIFTAYQLFISSWALWVWYAYPLFPMSIFFFPKVINQILEEVSQYDLFLRVINVTAVIFSVLLGLQMALGSMNIGMWSFEGGLTFRYNNYQLAQQLNDSLPDSKIIAMGDRAGSFGYFFNGHVLQLEGLVADDKLIDALRTNTLTSYMNDFGVDYLLTYHSPPEEYDRSWVLLTPYPEFSNGPKAELVLCKEMVVEQIHFSTTSHTVYMWSWPGCPD